MEKIHQIENLLEELGITFDMGIDLEANVREWNLDWSLKGATIK